MLKQLMGKKTKKEKILAEYRRKLRVLETAPKAKPQPEDLSVKATPVGKLVKYQWLNHSSEMTLGFKAVTSEPNRENLNYVASDLKRISFLATLAICAQLVLWYLLRK